MKKSEVKGELLKMVESIQKRQRISKYSAAWQVKHAMKVINNEINEEIMQKRESEYYKP
jgi:hypothetical protein